MNNPNLDDLKIETLKANINDLIRNAHSNGENTDLTQPGLIDIVNWFENRLSEMNLLQMTVDDKKLMELMVSFCEDEWWLEEEDYDEDEEYDEDTAPERYCIFCQGGQFIGDPNPLEHDSKCPVFKLEMILYEIDFTKIDYRREEVSI